MTNEIQHTPPPAEQKPIPFGGRLKSARESLGLERKDAAAQLRLNEKIIIMMEKDRYPADLPATFIRGYIRAYGRLLQIPEHEIKKAIEPIKPKPNPNANIILNKTSLVEPVTSSNYFMQFFTYMIIFTLLGLVAIWWYTHNSQKINIGSAFQGSPATTGTADNLNQVTPPSLDANQTIMPANAPPAATNESTSTIEKPAVVEPAIKPPSVSNSHQAKTESSDAETSDEPEQEMNNEQSMAAHASVKPSDQAEQTEEESEEIQPDQASIANNEQTNGENTE